MPPPIHPKDHYEELGRESIEQKNKAENQKYSKPKTSRRYALNSRDRNVSPA
jgi:hypothetical protein